MRSPSVPKSRSYSPEDRNNLLLLPFSHFRLRNHIDVNALGRRLPTVHSRNALHCDSFAGTHGSAQTLAQQDQIANKLYGAVLYPVADSFYVDDGKNLPFWNRLPKTAFGVFPAAAGIPFIVRALLQHPLVKSISTA